MLVSVMICCFTCILMILSILFFPHIRIGKYKLDTYWIITIIGAVFILIFGGIDISLIGEAFIADTAVNPLKILVLFISMSLLSIYLDEVGFFRFLANVVLRHASMSQKRLFLYLYLMVSILTVFTSNDIIILSFTPLICYFAKNADIDPLPYLAAEFVAANTWSMALVIGNPTNIYLATAHGISFLTYLKFSLIPTFLGGGIALLILFLLFRKKLERPIQPHQEVVEIKDKISLWIGIIHLGVCTIFLAISSYIHLEMWIVSSVSLLSLILTTLIYALICKRKPKVLFQSLKRTPYTLIPFMISMFIMVVELSDLGVTKIIGDFMGNSLPILKYGITSFISSNVMNNIPMSVLFSSIIESLDASSQFPAVFATIIGSNVGAFLTPIGALAGIMWGKIMESHNIKFGYFEFIKMGVIVAIPTLLVSLGGLLISLTIFMS